MIKLRTVKKEIAELQNNTIQEIQFFENKIDKLAICYQKKHRSFEKKRKNENEIEI